MAYTAIGLREKKGLSLSQQSSEQITQRFTQYENNSIKQISLIVTVGLIFPLYPPKLWSLKMIQIHGNQDL